MAETKGNSQTRAKNKYNSKNYDSLRIVVAKGQKEVLQSIAKEQGASRVCIFSRTQNRVERNRLRTMRT